MKRRTKTEAWHKKHRRRSPETVVEELKRRVLGDLERCRQVWEHEPDPLALMEAVRLANLPEWLTDALLFAIHDAASEKPLLARWWRRKERDNIDKARAEAVASARTYADRIPALTWERAYRIADARTRLVYDDMPPVTSAAVKKSYQQVAKNLSESHRYYRPPPELRVRLSQGLDRIIARWQGGCDGSTQKSGERREGLK